MDYGLFCPWLALQPDFQQVSLVEGHSFLPKPQTHPAPALMYNGCFHSKPLLMEKGSRKTAPFRSFSSFLSFHLSLGFLGGTGLVDILGSG